MLKPGDWVKQYSAGYWQIVDIKPKYAEEDGKNTKKGDLIGSWALLKKGFTPKMKFRVDSDCCDAAWCKPVSAEELAAINEYFAAHLKDAEKFAAKSFVTAPAISALWLELPEAEKARFEEAVASLPERFTQNQLFEILEAKELLKYVSKPSPYVNATLQMNHLLWELDENFDCIYTDPILEYSEK
ncbi:MAG: hypothetical protein IJW21_06105 [Clostridia bacterium]|nr:hypothetical protein [Clostridia bacterium]